MFSPLLVEDEKVKALSDSRLLPFLLTQIVIPQVVSVKGARWLMVVNKEQQNRVFPDCQKPAGS